MSTVIVVTETGYSGSWAAAVYATEELAREAIERAHAATQSSSPNSYRSFGLDELEIRTDLMEEL